MNIDRCYCEKRTFASLLKTARSERIGLAELSKRTGCGTHCGWCVAYVRRSLETGRVAFDETFPKEKLPDDD